MIKIKNDIIKSLVSLVLMLMMSSSMISQQSNRGTVTDKDGLGVPGATVQIKNRNFATSTNLDGTYQFNVTLTPGNYILAIS